MIVKKRIDKLERETGEIEPIVFIVCYEGRKEPRRPTEIEINEELSKYSKITATLVWDGKKFTNRRDA